MWRNTYPLLKSKKTKRFQTPKSPSIGSSPVIATAILAPHVIAAGAASVAAIPGEVAPLTTLVALERAEAAASAAAAASTAPVAVVVAAAVVEAASVVAAVLAFGVLDDHGRAQHVLAILCPQRVLCKHKKRTQAMRICFFFVSQWNRYLACFLNCQTLFFLFESKSLYQYRI
jgi:hypothetical protein